ncbi:MAG: U32 family peptidase [Alphaproteobacteria bacterium]|nr:U32 family peptidase [Alphaproteobacteria bacterium]
MTLGPLFFNWSAEKRRDFYFRIADEADVDTVYLGEVVCSKREAFFEEHLPAVVERLKKAGKKIVLSTLALVTSDREMTAIEQRVGQGFLIEANDVACLKALDGKPHVVGPFINVFSESARDFMIRNKASRIVLPVELSGSSIEILAGGSKAETEVLVFGRTPLSVAMRCYHARAYGLNKDGCRIVCGKDPDGLAADTLDGEAVLTVNGSQTLSRGYGVLLNELHALLEMGVSHFRLSPQDVDMVKVTEIYRSVLDKKTEAREALAKLKKITGAVPYENGFYYGKEGLSWIVGKKSLPQSKRK